MPVQASCVKTAVESLCATLLASTHPVWPNSHLLSRLVVKKFAFSLLLIFSSISPSIASSETLIKKAYVDQKNDVHVISPEGADEKITSSGRAQGVKLSTDGKTAIWLVQNSWIAEGDTAPAGSAIAIYSYGKLRQIRCDPFIRNYWFWMGGKQIAIDCGGRHFAGNLTLYDATSLRKLDSLYQPDIPEEKRPAWARPEDYSDPATAQ